MGDKLMSDISTLSIVGAIIECGKGVSCTIKRISTGSGFYSHIRHSIGYSRNGAEFELTVELYRDGNVVVCYHKLDDSPISNDLDLLNAMRLNTFNSKENKDFFFTDIVDRSVLTSPWGLVSLLIWNDRLNMNEGLDEWFGVLPQYVYGCTENRLELRLLPLYIPERGDYRFSLQKKHYNNWEMIVLSVDMYQNVCYIGYSRMHNPYCLKLVRRGDSVFSSCWYAQNKIIASVDEFISMLALNEGR
jgi:hypothetical protein